MKLIIFDVKNGQNYYLDILNSSFPKLNLNIAKLKPLNLQIPKGSGVGDGEIIL